MYSVAHGQCSLRSGDVSAVCFRSTTYSFNPKPSNPSFLSHSLVELLSQISPAFKKNFTSLQKKRQVPQHRSLYTPFRCSDVHA